MIQKMSRVVIADESGAGWIQVFHLYGGSWRRNAPSGSFVKGAIKAIAFFPPRIWGKRYKALREGYKVRGILLRTRHWRRFGDNTRVVFSNNDAVLIKRRGLLRSPYTRGPLPRLIRRRRYRALFESYV
jgi:ribosomal protein L14